MLKYQKRAKSLSKDEVIWKNLINKDFGSDVRPNLCYGLYVEYYQSMYKDLKAFRKNLELMASSVVTGESAYPEILK